MNVLVRPSDLLQMDRNELGRSVKSCSNYLDSLNTALQIFLVHPVQVFCKIGLLNAKIMTVYCGFTLWSYSGETDHAGKASVASDFSPGCFKKKLKQLWPLPGDCQFNMFYPDSMRFFAALLRLWSCLGPVPKLGPSGLYTGTVWTRV